MKLAHQLFKDLLELCAYYIKKMDNREEAPQFLQDEHQLSLLSHLHNNPLEDSISMIERTSIKIYPIIKDLLKKTIQESTPKEANTAAGTINRTEFNLKTTVSPVITSHELVQQELKVERLGAIEEPDMRSILGFLNQTEWIYSLNIGNIMQIAPISLQEIHMDHRNEYELSRESFLEKLSLLCVAYFCVSTEMRFIIQQRELVSPLKETREKESEYWHAKALELACSFLPSECPLLNHILISYQKHHSPSHQTIQEEGQNADKLQVIRPLMGIESNKFQPIVRVLEDVKV